MIGLERREDESLSLLQFETRAVLPRLSLGETLVLETMGLRFEGSVDYCHDEASSADYSQVRSFGLEIVAAVRVQDDHVRPCRACTNDGVPAPHFSEILLRKKLRFSRSDPHATIEATVSRVERRECASLSIVYLQTPSGPPLLCMGDTLILKTLDGERYWECDVRIYADDRFFEDHSEQSLQNSTVVVHVRDEQVIMGPKLLPPQLMGILVQPAPKPLCHLTNNGRGATSQREHKRSALNEAQCRAKPKIKIGINGYGGIGRIIARVALQSQDVELVAINDTSITTDHMTCMFRDCNTDGPWRQSDFKVKDSSTLLFGDKEVTIFTINERHIIPWYKTGAEYIVETIDCNQSADDYRVHASQHPRYIDIGSNSIDISNRLAPLSNILHDRFGTCVCSPATQNSCRAPVLQIILGKTPSAAKAVSEVLSYWNGMETVMRFYVPAVDEPILDVTVELDGFRNYKLIARNTKPNVDFCKVMAWCVDMVRQIPQVWLCRLRMSPAQG